MAQAKARHARMRKRLKIRELYISGIPRSACFGAIGKGEMMKAHARNLHLFSWIGAGCLDFRDSDGVAHVLGTQIHVDFVCIGELDSNSVIRRFVTGSESA